MPKQTFEVDYRELTQLLKDAQPLASETKTVARKEVNREAFKLVGQVKIKMPVDTGRAKGSWGLFTSPGSEGKGTADDAIFRFEDEGMTHVQGSNLDYIQRLNEGWSRQAPAGFIDTEAERAGMDLENALIDGVIGLIVGNPFRVAF